MQLPAATRRSFLASAFAGVPLFLRAEAPKVKLQRLPEGGVQPQAAVDRDGIVHVVYLGGALLTSDVFYMRSADGGLSFGPPIQVNHGAGSAIATGAVRGVHLAVGAKGAVHVAWNGSKDARPVGPGNQPPFLYTRLAGKSFEPERNLIHSAYGLDGGGSIAADAAGNVYAFWHAPEPGKQGEEHRRVWMGKSVDSGEHFGAERSISQEGTGACGCCGMSAFVDSHGSVCAFYRSAFANVHRNMYLLSSSDHGANFSAREIDRWEVGACVMSTEAFAEGGGRTLAAWETEGQVRFSRIDGGQASAGAVQKPPAQMGKSKYPSLALNSKGQGLMVWSSGAGWNKAGTLAWHLFDHKEQPYGDPGVGPLAPVFSFAASFARPDGGFTIVY